MTITVQKLPLRLIAPDPNNPRQTFDQDKLKELAASIKSIGQEQPISVKCSDQSTSRATDLEGITFVNDHTFAYVTPPYSLDYKTTSASWQNSIP